MCMYAGNKKSASNRHGTMIITDLKRMTEIRLPCSYTLLVDMG